MNLKVLGLIAELEGVAGMARLTAGAASGLAAQTFWLGGFRPVGGRRAGTVVAVLRGRVAQPRHFLLQRHGVVHQLPQVGLTPIPELRPTLND